MAETFDCPKCGGPISFDPHPGDETVECPFCHETVIIPQELQVPLPRMVVTQPASPIRSKRRNWSIFALALISVCVLCIIGTMVENPSDPSTAVFPTNTVASESSKATSVVEVKATGDALQPLLKLEQSWPANFTDNFMDNNHKWQTGDVRDGNITGNRSISNGAYTWNITAVQSTSDFSLPNLPDQKDFYASVDLKFDNMPKDPDADAGIFFRYNSADQTWYYFAVNDTGEYYFGWYNGKDWFSLISDTSSSAIHIGQTNRLSVGVQGQQFIFLINGQMVDHFIDNNLSSGNIGVGINLPNPGEKAVVEFSNFSVLSSPTNP